MLAERRHIITAMGLANALGDNVESVWTALLEGRPRTSAPPFELPFETVCGAVQGTLDPLSPSEREFDSRLARIAAHVKQDLRSQLVRHGLYIREHGDDLPEIRDWKWPY